MTGISSQISQLTPICLLHTEKLNGVAPLITDPPPTISTTLSSIINFENVDKSEGEGSDNVDKVILFNFGTFR